MGQEKTQKRHGVFARSRRVVVPCAFGDWIRSWTNRIVCQHCLSPLVVSMPLVYTALWRRVTRVHLVLYRGHKIVDSMCYEASKWKNARRHLLKHSRWQQRAIGTCEMVREGGPAKKSQIHGPWKEGWGGGAGRKDGGGWRGRHL